jgi:hypothetical protein
MENTIGIPIVRINLFMGSTPILFSEASWFILIFSFVSLKKHLNKSKLGFTQMPHSKTICLPQIYYINFSSLIDKSQSNNRPYYKIIPFLAFKVNRQNMHLQTAFGDYLFTFKMDNSIFMMYRL